jgi:hypothetical protein
MFLFNGNRDRSGMNGKIVGTNLELKVVTVRRL